MTHERIVFLFHFTPGSNSSIYVWYSLIDVLNIVQRQNMCSSYRGSLRSASLEKLRPGCWKERLRPNIRFCSGCGTADRLFILTVHMCFVFKTAYERVTSPVITSSGKWLKERDSSNEQLLQESAEVFQARPGQNQNLLRGLYIWSDPGTPVDPPDVAGENPAHELADQQLFVF